MSILASFSNLISIGGRAYDLSKSVQNIELKEAIMELREKLLDVKNDVISLTEENANLKAQLAKSTAPAELIFRDRKYSSTDGAEFFCVGCYDGQNKKVRLIKTQFDFANIIGPLQCPVCQTGYQK